MIQIPLAIHKHGFVPPPGDPRPARQPGHRSGPHDLLLQAQAAHPNRLTIRTGCLVTKIVLSEATPLRAVGMERAQIAAHGIECRVDLPGVGRNLHDRYEVGVVSEMKEDFSLLKDVTFGLPSDGAAPDPALAEWRKNGTGVYLSNGAVLGIFKWSKSELIQPDLFIFGLPLRFPGYEIGYSKSPQHHFFTWAILKAHTQNRDGTVQLRNADLLETPLINFHETSWKLENQAKDHDIQALVDGVKFVNGIARCAGLVVKGRNHPTTDDVRDLGAADDQQLRNWIRREA